VLGRRVLVLSEDRLLVDLVTTNLGRRGYEVQNTSLGRACQYRWAGLDSELLLLDAEPPGCDPVMAVQLLLASGWRDNVPVVVLCDAAPDGNGLDSRWGVHWVVKPFTIEALLLAVRRAMSGGQGLN